MTSDAGSKDYDVLIVGGKRRFPIAPRHEVFGLIEGGATEPLPEFSPSGGPG